MAIPDYQSVMLPLLRFTAAQGGEVSTAKAIRQHRSANAHV